MTRARRLLLIPALISVLAMLVTGCGTSDTSGKPSPQTAYTAVIDVRTPAEYAAGHVDGARNIDVQSAAFATDVASLAKTGTYLVYCHSGNRAAQAAKIMQAVGLSVINGGGLTDMQSAGFHIGV